MYGDGEGVGRGMAMAVGMGIASRVSHEGVEKIQRFS